jgi:hypothetical protein
MPEKSEPSLALRVSVNTPSITTFVTIHLARVGVAESRMVGHLEPLFVF